MLLRSSSRTSRSLSSLFTRLSIAFVGLPFSLRSFLRVMASSILLSRFEMSVSSFFTRARRTFASTALSSLASFFLAWLKYRLKESLRRIPSATTSSACFTDMEPSSLSSIPIADSAFTSLCSSGTAKLSRSSEIGVCLILLFIESTTSF